MITLLLSLAMTGDTLAMASDQGSADDNKRVCRYVESLGSKIPKRTCRTKAEWTQLDEAIEQESSEAMRREQSYGRGTQNRND